MKAKVKATGEKVDVYLETQHGRVENVYKESTLVGGRMWLEDDLEFIEEFGSDDLDEEIYKIQKKYKTVDEYELKIK